MGLRINQNIEAMNAYRNLSITSSAMSKSLEKLSSGFRINRAADDAAGLSISEGLRAQIGGLKVAVRNTQDGVSVVQTAEGALTETHSILQRMRDLAVQSSNSGSQDTAAQKAADTEFTQLKTELDRIAGTTAYGTQKLLNGSYGASNQVSGTYNAFTPVKATGGNLSVTFNITKADGSVGTDVVATVADGTYTTADELVSAANDAIRTQLKATPTNTDPTVNYTGDEVRMQTENNPNQAGQNRFVLTGSAAFSITATTDGTLSDGTGTAGFTGLTAAASTTNGTAGSFQVGANNNSPEQINIAITSQDSTTLGLRANQLDTTAHAQAAITAVDNAISTVSNTRATLGAYQNRFEHTINNLNVTVENLTASESRIRDTDMAQEMVSFTRSQILSQAGTAMLAQANQAPQSVLSLLKG